jgi:hypothetical protein
MPKRIVWKMDTSGIAGQPDSAESRGSRLAPRLLEEVDGVPACDDEWPDRDAVPDAE